MQLQKLIQGVDCTLRPGAPAELRVTDIVEDSRTAMPGCLFIAKPGTLSHGAHFIHDAIDRGATSILVETGTDTSSIPAGIATLETRHVARSGAALAERFFRDPSANIRVAGVTGTNGKTTVTTLAQSMLNHAGIPCGLIGTVSIDDGRDVGAATLTTPPATELSRSLATMREHACKAAMLECSSHALEQGRCDGVRFHAALFTNLSGDHLDYHNDMEQYARAKSRLFELLGDGVAIVNAADPYCDAMLNNHTGAHALRFAPIGSSIKADATARVLEATLGFQRLELTGPWGVCEGTLHAAGAHNATNALAAACLASQYGLDAHAIGDAISNAKMPTGRLERITTRRPEEPAVFIDFAHTDDALSTTLASLKDAMQPDQRLITLFGCGGDRDSTKRPRMGRAACAHADIVVLSSDNPRTESPDAIINDVLAGLKREEHERIHVEADRARAIAHAIQIASARDVVVIAGKGHEREQLTPDGAGGIARRPFDDAQHARAALERWSGRVAAP